MKKRKNKKGFLIGGIAAGAVVILAGGGILAWKLLINTATPQETVKNYFALVEKGQYDKMYAMRESQPLLLQYHRSKIIFIFSFLHTASKYQSWITNKQKHLTCGLFQSYHIQGVLTLESSFLLFKCSPYITVNSNLRITEFPAHPVY